MDSLNIYCNGIGIIGARSIAAMLTTNKSLAVLNLDNNAMIGAIGVIAITDALEQNESLTKLVLSDIPITVPEALLQC